MSDHYHYGYADERHSHRGEYAEDRHDHDGDYAGKYHRHYDDESTARGLREDLGRAEARISELEDGLRDALNRIHALEDRLPDYADEAGDQDQDAEAAEDTRRLDRIRIVLAKFDWEHDDRQFALEAIERIAEGGQA